MIPARAVIRLLVEIMRLGEIRAPPIEILRLAGRLRNEEKEKRRPVLRPPHPETQRREKILDRVADIRAETASLNKKLLAVRLAATSHHPVIANARVLPKKDPSINRLATAKARGALLAPANKAIIRGQENL